jgi:hypothetical protein
MRQQSFCFSADAEPRLGSRNTSPALANHADDRAFADGGRFEAGASNDTHPLARCNRRGVVSLLTIMARFDPRYLSVLINFLRLSASLEAGDDHEAEFHAELRKEFGAQGLAEGSDFTLVPVVRGEASSMWGPDDVDIFEAVLLWSSQHGMRTVANTAERILEILRDLENQRFDALRWLPQLSDAIQDDLGAMMLHWIDPAKAHLFEPETAPFGERVDRQFPSAAPDIRESCSCFALERYTASVFHLMRILEWGLTALAADVGVRRAQQRNPNWHNVLLAVEKKIKFYEQQKNTKPTKKRLERLGDAAAHLRTFKNAWRNKTSHDLDAVYQPEQARDIMNAVSAFMRSVATWLRERPVRDPPGP